MSCKCCSFQINQIIRIDGEPSCAVCDVRFIFDPPMVSTYMGMIDDNHAFELVAPFSCLECKSQIEMIHIPCAESDREIIFQKLFFNTQP